MIAHYGDLLQGVIIVGVSMVISIYVYQKAYARTQAEMSAGWCYVARKRAEKMSGDLPS